MKTQQLAKVLGRDERLRIVSDICKMEPPSDVLLAVASALGQSRVQAEFIVSFKIQEMAERMKSDGI